MSAPRPMLATCASLALLLLSACGSNSSSSGSPPPDYRAALRDAPPPLAALYAQGDRLLDGGLDAFQKRLAGLHGHPVVVNAWGSWCGPCREEFPILQRESARFGDRVAFVGLDVDDSDAAARTFLGEHPVPYPSYSDPDKTIVNDVSDNSAVGLPITAFYDASGQRTYLHLGPYTSAGDLTADIRRYAS